MSMGNFPEVVTQRMSVGIIVVGRLGAVNSGTRTRRAGDEYERRLRNQFVKLHGSSAPFIVLRPFS